MRLRHCNSQHVARGCIGCLWWHWQRGSLTKGNWHCLEAQHISTYCDSRRGYYPIFGLLTVCEDVVCLDQGSTGIMLGASLQREMYIFMCCPGKHTPPYFPRAWHYMMVYCLLSTLLSPNKYHTNAAQIHTSTRLTWIECFSHHVSSCEP